MSNKNIRKIVRGSSQNSALKIVHFLFPAIVKTTKRIFNGSAVAKILGFKNGKLSNSSPILRDVATTISQRKYRNDRNKIKKVATINYNQLYYRNETLTSLKVRLRRVVKENYSPTLCKSTPRDPEQNS